MINQRYILLQSLTGIISVIAMLVLHISKNKENLSHQNLEDRFLISIMEKDKIYELSQKMKTVGHLASLLYQIKCDEFGTKKHKITAKQLRYFSMAKTPKRYKTFQIRKKSGGIREINAPCYQLKVILYFLNKLLKAIYTPNESAMGFAEGRSVVTNAQQHIGCHYVFNIDLENFFPSIPQSRVWKRLQLPPFNFSQEIANVVAGLCCHPNAEGTMNVLPQGAATSPILTNAICEKLDRRMRGVAKRFGLHYSRYADDMTFSSMHNVYREGHEFRLEIKRIIEEQGFKMNDKKTRLLRNGRRQEVTGLTVNSSVNVSRKYIKYLRWILHIWEKEGYAKAYSEFYPRYKHDKGYIKKGEPIMENVIGGKLNYLRMVATNYKSDIIGCNKFYSLTMRQTGANLISMFSHIRCLYSVNTLKHLSGLRYPKEKILLANVFFLAGTKQLRLASQRSRSFVQA